MFNVCKTVSLAIAVVTAIPVIAIEPNEIQPGDMICIIDAGDDVRVEECDVVETVGGPAIQVTSEEKAEGHSESKLRRFYGFLSSNTFNIACGLLSAASLYFLVFTVMPKIRALEDNQAVLVAEQAMQLRESIIINGQSIIKASENLISASDNLISASDNLMISIESVDNRCKNR